MANKQQVIDANAAQPDWTVRQIADSLGCHPEYVRKCKELYDLNIPPAKREAHA